VGQGRHADRMGPCHSQAVAPSPHAAPDRILVPRPPPSPPFPASQRSARMTRIVTSSPRPSRSPSSPVRRPRSRKNQRRELGSQRSFRRTSVMNNVTYTLAVTRTGSTRAIPSGTTGAIARGAASWSFNPRTKAKAPMFDHAKLASSLSALPQEAIRRRRLPFNSVNFRQGREDDDLSTSRASV